MELGRQGIFVLLGQIIIRLRRTRGGEYLFVLGNSKNDVEVTFPIYVVLAFEFVWGKDGWERVERHVAEVKLKQVYD